MNTLTYVSTIKTMKIAMIAGASLLLCGAAALAADAPTPDANMKCSDYIAASKAAGTWHVSSGDKDADALDKKIDDYCEAHPAALVLEVVQKAMSGQ